MDNYEHTQKGTYIRGWVGFWMFAFFFGAIVLASINEGSGAIALALSALSVAGIVALFHSLTVHVSGEEIALSFGIGLIRKRFLIKTVKTASIVQNRWYHGWGIKRIKGGWLYNVGGWDAVEIQLENGRKNRIGTDEPEALLAAIESVIENPNKTSGELD